MEQSFQKKMNKKYKIGDIVRDKNTEQLGIIIEKYKGHGDFDWEVIAIKKPFYFGYVWKDCFKEEELDNYNWKDYPKMLWDKIKLLFKR